MGANRPDPSLKWMAGLALIMFVIAAALFVKG